METGLDRAPLRDPLLKAAVEHAGGGVAIVVEAPYKTCRPGRHGIVVRDDQGVVAYADLLHDLPITIRGQGLPPRP